MSAEYTQDDMLLSEQDTFTVVCRNVPIVGNYVINSLNASDDMSSPFEFFSDGISAIFIEEANKFIRQRILESFNSAQIKKIYKTTPSGYISNSIKLRYSILTQQLPLNMEINEFRINWNKTYIKENMAKKIEEIMAVHWESLGLNNYEQLRYVLKIKQNCMSFDWIIYKFFCEFCQFNLVADADIKYLYGQIFLNNSYRVKKIVDYIELNKSDVVFLQKISAESVTTLKKLLPDYYINYGRNMAIVHHEHDMKTQFIENHIENLFELKIGNEFAVFISVYIQNIKEFINVLMDVEIDPRKIIVGITCDFDLFEEKFELNGLNLTKSSATTYTKKTVMQPLYRDVNRLNNQSCDFILTNMLIDYVGVFPLSTDLLPNNNHPFKNYMLTVVVG